MRIELTRRCALAIEAPPCAEPVVADDVPVAPVDPAAPVVAADPEPLAVDPLPPALILPGPEPIAPDVVPVTSMRWPTCFLRSDSCPSRMYDVLAMPAADPDLPGSEVPDVPAEDFAPVVPVVALASVYAPPGVDALAASDEAVALEVPRSAPAPCCRQPVTVTVLPPLLLIRSALFVAPPCAATPTMQIVPTAKAAAVHAYRFM